MGITSLFPIIATIIVSGILAKTVAPSVIEQIKSTKVEAQAIGTKTALFEAIKRYITLEQSNPATMNDLTSKGYFLSSNNTNGFGGTYSFTIDSSKGTVTITTDIADAKARTRYINSYKNTYNPVQGSGNYVNTTFVLPTSVMHGNGQFMSGIPVQSTAPSASTYKYWYDTSAGVAVLRMSDGSNWKKMANTVSAPTSIAASVVSSESAMPTTNNVEGDIKYMYDSNSNSIQQYVYYNNGWAQVGQGDKYVKLVGTVRQWADGSYAKSCLKYIQPELPTYKYTGDTGDGVYTIDPDGDGGNAAFDVYCDMTTDGGGWTYFQIIKTSNFNASAIEKQCNEKGLQLFVPRTKNHFIASVQKFGAGWFKLMGIYPTFQGAKCVGSSFKKDGCSAWAPFDNGRWYVQDYKYISEPNGDNDIDGSMKYTYNSDGTVNWYNDVYNSNTSYIGGYSTYYWICSSLDEL